MSMDQIMPDVFHGLSHVLQCLQCHVLQCFLVSLTVGKSRSIKYLHFRVINSKIFAK